MPNLSDIVVQVRRDILRMVHQVNSGHPGGSLGCTEFMVILYFKIMNINKLSINIQLFVHKKGRIPHPSCH